MFVNKADVYEAVERSVNAADSASLKDRFTDIVRKLKTYGNRRKVQVMNRQPSGNNGIQEAAWHCQAWNANELDALGKGKAIVKGFGKDGKC